jgi:hypothetical protein
VHRESSSKNCTNSIGISLLGGHFADRFVQLYVCKGKGKIAQLRGELLPDRRPEQSSERLVFVLLLFLFYHPSRSYARGFAPRFPHCKFVNWVVDPMKALSSSNPKCTHHQSITRFAPASCNPGHHAYNRLECDENIGDRSIDRL